MRQLCALNRQPNKQASWSATIPQSAGMCQLLIDFLQFSCGRISSMPVLHHVWTQLWFCTSSYGVSALSYHAFHLPAQCSVRSVSLANQLQLQLSVTGSSAIASHHSFNNQQPLHSKSCQFSPSASAPHLRSISIAAPAGLSLAFSLSAPVPL